MGLSNHRTVISMAAESAEALKSIFLQKNKDHLIKTRNNRFHCKKNIKKKPRNYCKIKWGGYFCKIFTQYFLQMETKSLKAYQAPRMEILDLELKQGVLYNTSNYSDTEELDEENFAW